MPKIVYPVCCGIDVHKSFVVACIAKTDEKLVTTYKSKRFSTFTGDLTDPLVSPGATPAELFLCCTYSIG